MLARPPQKHAADSSLLRRAAVRLPDLVAELHAAGWAHGCIDGDAVLVDASGLVCLVGFSAAVRAGAPEFAAAVARDRRNAGELVRMMRETAMPNPTAASAGRVEGETDGSSSSLVDPASPITGGHGAGATDRDADSRDRRALDLRHPDAPDSWSWQAAPAPAAPPGEPDLIEVMEPAMAAVRELVPAARNMSALVVRTLVRSRRLRTSLLGGAVVCCAVIAACLVVPSSQKTDAVTAISTVSPSRSPSPTAVAPSGAQATTAATPPVETDDPVAAIASILAVRRQCLRARDLACLDLVDQWGSPAERADRELIRSAATTEPVDPLAVVEGWRLLDRAGSSATLRADAGATAQTKKPVSFLVMRDETGWRLRWYDSG